MNDNIEALRAENERLKQDLDAALRANAALDAVIDRCRLDATTAEAKLEEAAKVLEFYRDGFTFTTNARYGGLEWKPTDTLLDDCGNAARTFLANLKGAE